MCARWVSTVRTERNSLLADLGVRVAQRDEPQHLGLAFGEVVRRPSGRLGRCRHAAPELGVEVGPAGRRAAHRLHELGVGRLLEDVA